MSTTPTIEYDKFATLDGLDLCHYMEPLVTDPATKVSEDALQRMWGELRGYDKYHLVYALTLGAIQSPKTFARSLPQYLAHESGSVCCAALNMIDRLPDEYIDENLVEAVRNVVSTHQVRPFVTELLDRLKNRLHEKQRRR